MMDTFRKFLDSLSKEELDLGEDGESETDVDETSENPREIAIKTLGSVRAVIEMVRELIREVGVDPIDFVSNPFTANSLMFALLAAGVPAETAAVVSAIATILEIDGIQSLTEGK